MLRKFCPMQNVVQQRSDLLHWVGFLCEDLDLGEWCCGFISRLLTTVQSPLHVRLDLCERLKELAEKLRVRKTSLFNGLTNRVWEATLVRLLQTRVAISLTCLSRASPLTPVQSSAHFVVWQLRGPPKHQTSQTRGAELVCKPLVEDFYQCS